MSSSTPTTVKFVERPPARRGFMPQNEFHEIRPDGSEGCVFKAPNVNNSRPGETIEAYCGRRWTEHRENQIKEGEALVGNLYQEPEAVRLKFGLSVKQNPERNGNAYTPNPDHWKPGEADRADRAIRAYFDRFMGKDDGRVEFAVERLPEQTLEHPKAPTLNQDTPMRRPASREQGRGGMGL